MPKRHHIWIIPFILSFFVSSLLPENHQNYSLPEVQKVLRVIDNMIAAQFQEDRDVLEQVEITESELNSYFTYRIETEKEEIMKELSLKIFDDQRLEGKIFIDLEGQKIPKILRPQMNIYMGGKIIIQDGKIRLDIKSIYLDGQSIQPMVLDLIIFIAAKIENFEPYSLSDWYELPYGIKNIETQKGKATFYY